MIPIESAIRAVLSKVIRSQVQSIHLDAVTGGSINECFCLTVNNGLRFFCKVNSAKKYPALFEKEKNGLKLLGSYGIFRVPKVYASEIADGYQILILEWIKPGTCNKKFWKLFGEKLAALHQVSNEYFGWAEDNYMGALPQSNPSTGTWVEFLMNERLVPQIKRASDNHLLSPENLLQFNNLYPCLSNIFLPQPPSLIHGDLWSGNFLCDENDEPVLIDPAPYFGHRAMDLAMTGLFGGFDETFYQSYRYNFPLPENYLEQWDICRLYPLLIHLNLFGLSYLQQILKIIKPY